MPPESSRDRSSWVADSNLWLVLDRTACIAGSLLQCTNAAIDGGVQVVVFRYKSGPFAEVLPEALEIRELCGARRIPFVLAHAVEYFGQLAPDGMHFSSDAALRIRQSLPDLLTCGVSTHSATEAVHQLEAGFDYAFLGPLYSTPSKLPFGPPLGISELLKLDASYQERIVGIGGIDTAQARELAIAGLRRIAVIRAILSNADPKRAAAKLLNLVAPDQPTWP